MRFERPQKQKPLLNPSTHIESVVFLCIGNTSHKFIKCLFCCFLAKLVSYLILFYLSLVFPSKDCVMIGFSCADSQIKCGGERKQREENWLDGIMSEVHWLWLREWATKRKHRVVAQFASVIKSVKKNKWRRSEQPPISTRKIIQHWSTHTKKPDTEPCIKLSIAQRFREHCDQDLHY